MAKSSIFLSVVMVAHNIEAEIEYIMSRLHNLLPTLVTDYEVVVIDNASTDDTINKLKLLTSDNRAPNTLVQCLTSNIQKEQALMVGVESALGDYVLVYDPTTDDDSMIGQMISQATSYDIVLAYNSNVSVSGSIYKLFRGLYKYVYYLIEKKKLGRDDALFRVMSRKFVNYLLQHQRSDIAFRHVSSNYGFSRKVLDYSYEINKTPRKRTLFDAIDRGIDLIISHNRIPMRIATLLCIFGAVANALYSLYVISVALFKQNIQPGWVTLSLQQSGMFFLISLVLLVIGEYLLNISNHNRKPSHHISHEFTSSIMTRMHKINVEEN